MKLITKEFAKDKYSKIDYKEMQVLIKDIKDIDGYLAGNTIDIAMLAVPRDATRDAAEKVVSLGIKGLWNFSPMGVLVSDESVAVENVHLSDSLMVLGYKLRHNSTT